MVKIIEEPVICDRLDAFGSDPHQFSTSLEYVSPLLKDRGTFVGNASPFTAHKANLRQALGGLGGFGGFVPPGYFFPSVPIEQVLCWLLHSSAETARSEEHTSELQ